MIKLSKKQIGEADRVGGIELMIPWPDSLGPAPQIGEDREREATPKEKSEAERLVRAALLDAEVQPNMIIPVHTRVANICRPRDLPRPGYQVHLSVVLIGRRWVHASTKRSPRVMFAATHNEK